MRNTITVLMTFAVLIMLSTGASAALNCFQGVEVDTGDGVASKGITRVPSGKGFLFLPSSSGSYHAEIENLPNGYYPPFGDAGNSFYGGRDSVFHGDFYQAIDVYIDGNWALPVPYPPFKNQGDCIQYFNTGK